MSLCKDSRALTAGEKVIQVPLDDKTGSISKTVVKILVDVKRYATQLQLLN